MRPPFRRLFYSAFGLLVIGVLMAVLAWVTGSVPAVWAAIVLIAAAAMRWRIGSPVYQDTGGAGTTTIGGGGNAGE